MQDGKHGAIFALPSRILRSGVAAALSTCSRTQFRTAAFRTCNVLVPESSSNLSWFDYLAINRGVVAQLIIAGGSRPTIISTIDPPTTASRFDLPNPVRLIYQTPYVCPSARAWAHTRGTCTRTRTVPASPPPPLTTAHPHTRNAYVGVRWANPRGPQPSPPPFTPTRGPHRGAAAGVRPTLVSSGQVDDTPNHDSRSSQQAPPPRVALKH
ncbi:uncharacterized protein LOC125029878 [Penaeus chinensis]|uniref:uncharacterized protein LOC125029878 n=1 Tax=Penaeus chinensis TaxID=139456 RepID=UPI001FB5EFDD|nr:uncharacterized protein LOC125029878 [Penaeus chinensis]